jgi:aspartyl/asparaginyl beta-hydroxylase (cupin superfamily)
MFTWEFRNDYKKASELKNDTKNFHRKLREVLSVFLLLSHLSEMNMISQFLTQRNNDLHILHLDGYHEEYPSAASSWQCENLRLLVFFANPHLVLELQITPDVRLDLTS